MAGALKIKNGTKLKMAFDVPVEDDPVFNMLCTFYKSLDESAFLISIPMVNGKPLEVDDTKKLLIRYGDGKNAMILAGYVDDIVKDGIRRYLKIRRVSEQRQFFQRADERIKVALKVEYLQETWPVNEDGKIEPEEAMTLDVSAGGAALYINRRFDIGEVMELNLPRIGTSEKGKAIDNIVAAVCWMREAPKGSIYRNFVGVQFRFGEADEKKRIQAYLENVKEKYKL